MIFAAGLGTRLRPLTDTMPKALVPIGDTPILELVARRLVAAGADRLVINTHAFPGQIEALVRARAGFGVDVRLSHEPDAPLDTGGGLAQAAPQFRGDAPFLMHNCDVLSDIDLRQLYATQQSHDAAIATLAVLPPSAERYLIFDDGGLCGYSPRGGGTDVLVRATSGALRRFDFTGIHCAAPALLATLPAPASEPIPYSIVMHYLSLARAGERIAAFEQAAATWIDIGTQERLDAARAAFGG